jgi:hypothetical protein
VIDLSLLSVVDRCGVLFMERLVRNWSVVLLAMARVACEAAAA